MIKLIKIFLLIDVVILSILLSSCDSVDDPYDFVLEELTIVADDYYRGGKCELEIHRVRTLYSEFLDGDMMTADYVCVAPGQGVKGDIEGILEIYNPENTSWRAGDYDYVVVEYSRFGWGEQEIIIDKEVGMDVFHFGVVDSSGTIEAGYLTYHYYLEN